jgi:DNA-binding beta-propeller fold protein YncE
MKFALLISTLTGLLAVASAVVSAASPVPAAPTLTLEMKILLGDIRGRIDHLAVDPVHQRLYVAELGNNSVGVVDLRSHSIQATLAGYDEPQGIGYAASPDVVYIANGGDGSVRMLRGRDLAPVGRIDLGSDADNVRVDDATQRVYVGHGSGALAVIDTSSGKQVADIRLSGHPEGFRLAQDSARIFVNVPTRHEIAVIDRTQARQVDSWSTGLLFSNFPMMLDGPDRVISVFRLPARIGIFRSTDGRLLDSQQACGDADDVFADPRRHRLYVVCGEGFVDVFSGENGNFRKIDHLPTLRGTRTGLFVPETNQLYLAARASGREPASIWVFRPTP